VSSTNQNKSAFKVLGIVPARYASTRFPAKPLVDIAGKSMVEWVYSQAKKSSSLSNVVVATDNQKIYDHIIKFGGNACLTSEDHISGTDRCFEALQLQKEKYDYVINIQGDEPFIDPVQINLLASLLDGTTELATLAKRIEKEEQLFNPNVVKIVFNQLYEALYFSRSTIPYIRNVDQANWLSKYRFYKHIGMYAYRADVLEKITNLEISPLEKAESLEQLRWIDNGFKIKVAETDIETLGIDTPQDLDQALAYLKSKHE
jgi:3-deoxy-manno-octulosonate cytidylyltransferase (CMP-KDO synthetase)